MFQKFDLLSMLIDLAYLQLIEYQGERCYVALDDDWAKHAPEGFVVYTLAEMEMLKGKDDWTKRMVQEAKKHGGKVTGFEPM